MKYFIKKNLIQNFSILPKDSTIGDVAFELLFSISKKPNFVILNDSTSKEIFVVSKNSFQILYSNDFIKNQINSKLRVCDLIKPINKKLTISNNSKKELMKFLIRSDNNFEIMNKYLPVYENNSLVGILPFYSLFNIPRNDTFVNSMNCRLLITKKNDNKHFPTFSLNDNISDILVKKKIRPEIPIIILNKEIYLGTINVNEMFYYINSSPNEYETLLKNISNQFNFDFMALPTWTISKVAMYFKKYEFNNFLPIVKTFKRKEYYGYIDVHSLMAFYLEEIYKL